MKPLVLLILAYCFVLSNVMAQAADEQNTESTESTESTAEKNTDTSTDVNKENQTSDASNPSQNTRQQAIPPPISLIDQYKNDIKRSVNNDLLHSISLDGHELLTITQPDSHQADRGVAILLPEWSQAAMDPKAINFLRQYLPKHGWTTITLQPLTKPLEYPIQDKQLDVALEENRQLLQTYQTKLAAMMNAVMEKAAEYPGMFLVIAQGSNAAILIDLYHQEKIEKPNALVTLSTYLLTETDNQALVSNMSASDVPTLDLILKKDVLWVEHFANKRKMAAKNTMKTYYRQRELNNFRSGYYPLETLAKEIKGWITTIGW